MGQIAYLFPGQGSQKVGMAQDFFDGSDDVKGQFHQIDSALDLSLSQIMFEGPEEDLKRTENTQPAILTHSVLAFEALMAAGAPQPDVVAGHSLGEYSALVAAGCLDLESAAKAVQLRGRLMQNAVPVGTGAMAAVLGLAPDEVENLCSQASENENDYVGVANYNGSGQTVVAGKAGTVERLLPLFKEAGAKRALPLPVSAPFHCDLMLPVQAPLQSHLETLAWATPRMPWIANVDAVAHDRKEDIIPLLTAQVTAPVRFTQMVQTLLGQGVDTFVEIGPGKVLTGILKREAKGCRLLNVSHKSDVADVANTLSA
ncbi:MAG: [acyl-carrier-protein] S-malonyltransferase [Myxococcales bacterium]|nr:[acyl-carrier-protein] S-malonyltransferase [Myxococcales bacterium]